VDPVVVKAVFALFLAAAVFFGSCWLVVSMVIGVRMGYLVVATCLSGILVILSGIWFTNALGPKGIETTWHAIAAGPDLTEVTSRGESYDLSDYPEGSWEVPGRGKLLADLMGPRSPCLSLISPCAPQDTAKEAESAGPVMETLIKNATSPIPGKRESVSDLVQGQIALDPGSFAIADVRMQGATVDGKPSIIAVSRAVPSASLSEPLPAGIPEATVVRYLVRPGDTISIGQPVLEVQAGDQTFQMTSSRPGRIVSLGLRTDDRVTAGIPIATIDVSGQPGQPPPVEVAAVRVRGAIRTPALFYLVGSVVLFSIHLFALNRAERARRAVPQLA
jgi:hypothetical protein